MYRSTENTCLMPHFKQKYCISCDKILIQIGDALYELKVHYNKDCRVIDGNKRICDSENVIKIEELTLLPENYPQSTDGPSDECMVDTFKEECTTTNEIAIETVEESKEDCLSEDQTHSDIKYPTTNENLIRPFETDATQRNVNSISKPSIKGKGKEPRIKCSRCEAVFVKRRALSDHIKNEHKDKPYTYIYVCNVCGEKFTKKPLLNVHADIHSTETKVTCDICNEEFQNRYIILKHMKTHIGTFPCQFCDRKFTTTAYAKQHEYRVHEKKICNVCNEEYTDSRSHTLSHRRKINATQRTVNNISKPSVKRKGKESRIKCSRCEAVFVKRRALSDHIRNEHKDKRYRYNYVCNICGERFNKKYLLNVHASIHSTQTHVTCDICNEGFQNKYLILEHMKIHIGKFPCKFCDRKFTTTAYAKEHEYRVHEKKICKVCNEEYTDSRSHTISHRRKTDPRFICNYCGKVFAIKNHLNEHLNRHTGTKSYICEYCKKGFVTQGELRAHTRTHTGEKPYKCTIEGCTRVYTYDVDLRRHRFSAHGIYTKKHICHICSKVYSERKLLRKHIESHAKA